MVEVGEPEHGPNSVAGSVWFRWTAPTSGPVALTASNDCRFGFNATAAVYTGQRVYELEPVTVAYPTFYDPNNCTQAHATFAAAAGTTYMIAGAGRGSGGRLTMTQATLETPRARSARKPGLRKHGASRT
jgi:hypothetical protein